MGGICTVYLVLFTAATYVDSAYCRWGGDQGLDCFIYVTFQNSELVPVHPLDVTSRPFYKTALWIYMFKLNIFNVICQAVCIWPTDSI